ncbi:hypothetical protein Rhopal_000755-T1 [Rhodotorula paludigena]|uniref:SGT1-domain-containing protein n=1 Tax=Rhodotorula paludigena TaxID=86838 RepID=A0AAV5G5V9_9BASI|nr:hypothetical protein Rhopal_000755-T1 [Rhodotorula paludigena]
MASSRPPFQANVDSCSYEVDLPAPPDSAPDAAALCAEILAFVGSLSSGYIWHKQPFQLQPAPKTQQQRGVRLAGKTEVTDAVDDEWFLVWLLRKVTENWHDAVVAVEDGDGEFLLIEAADELPTWLTPQNAANRVWIYRGRLHLVPLEHKSALPFEQKGLNPSFDADEEGFLDRAAALELVRNDAVVTLAPKEVEAAVWARIEGYPGKIKEHHHRTLTYLPADVALALSDSPDLIAQAVGAFYEREPGTLRAVNAMSRFPPTSPLEPAPSSESGADSMTDSSPSLPGTVLVPTLLTRPLYSQLVLQRFYAPKPFEKAGWTDAKLGREDGRRRSVGMKIACGFEMLYKASAPLPRQPAEASDSLAGVDTSSARYRAYLKSLAEKGFFEEEVEGSEKWKEKELVAREGWAKAQADRPKLSFAQRVDDAISRARSRPQPLPSRVANPAALTPEAAAVLEDPEDWLALDEQGLEDLLQARQGKSGAQLGDSDLESDDASDDEDEEGDDKMQGGSEEKIKAAEEKKARKAARRLEEMAGKVEDFVQGRGAMDGALFDDEQDEDDSDVEMPEMSAEERASRMETLVAALPAEQWGERTAPAAVSSAPPPLTADDSPAAPDRPPRPSKFDKEVYEGASDLEDSSDDEAMPEGEEGLGGDEVEGEDGPSVLNEDDVLDLGEEMDEFLKFATETLGLTPAQYEKILQDRRGRGVFVPGPAKEKKTNVLPAKSTPSTKPAAPPVPSPAAATAAGNPPPPREPLRNPNLTDFDSLMERMETELAEAKKQSKPARASPTPAPASDAAPTAASSSRQSRDPNRIVVNSLDDSDDDGEDEGDLAAMDAELADMLKGMGGNGDGGTMDYNLVKNFLDSFQSQGGFAGPAGNLAGRLGFPLPRDTGDQ